jgi:hypothetical protein
MVSLETFRQKALSFPGAIELPHFELISFRINKKIFATYWQKDNRAMVKLPLVDQSVFCSFNKAIFFPVPGFWGTKGATFVDLSSVRKDMFSDALKIAYEHAAGKKS